MDGYKADVCGDSCKFDAAAAKQAFDAAGGYEGTLTMTYNADGPQQGLVRRRSATRSRTTWASTASRCRPSTSPPSTRSSTPNEIKGIFRSGWQADYPSIENYLSPLYTKGALPPQGSNYSKYDNPEFDKLLTQAAAAPDPRRGQHACTSRPRRLLAKDFPTAPLWNNKTTSAWSDKVTDVKVTAFGVLDFAAIKVK